MRQMIPMIPKDMIESFCASSSKCVVAGCALLDVLHYAKDNTKHCLRAGNDGNAVTTAWRTKVRFLVAHEKG